MERLQESSFAEASALQPAMATSARSRDSHAGCSKKERTDRDRLVSALAAERQHGPATRALGLLDEGELNRLVASAWDSGVMFEGLNGVDRAMIYLSAMTTGLWRIGVGQYDSESF